MKTAGKTSRRNGQSVKTASLSSECPEPDGVFGVTTDEIPGCIDCPLWDACDNLKYE